VARQEAAIDNLLDCMIAFAQQFELFQSVMITAVKARIMTVQLEETAVSHKKMMMDTSPASPVPPTTHQPLPVLLADPVNALICKASAEEAIKPHSGASDIQLQVLPLFAFDAARGCNSEQLYYFDDCFLASFVLLQNMFCNAAHCTAVDACEYRRKYPS
jgi:hypothetical protein